MANNTWGQYNAYICVFCVSYVIYWNYHYWEQLKSWKTYVWDEVSTWYNKRCIHLLYWEPKELRTSDIWHLVKKRRSILFFSSFRQCSDWCSSQVPHVEGKKSPLIGIWVEIRPIGHPLMSLIRVFYNKRNQFGYIPSSIALLWEFFPPHHFIIKCSQRGVNVLPIHLQKKFKI